MRGYLWEHVEEEIEQLFSQVHPLVTLTESVPYSTDFGWHIEKELGDMSGVRKSLIRRREEKSTGGVRDLRAQRKREGACIDCGLIRDPKSKNYCAKHREKDRLRAKAKADAKKTTKRA